MRALTLERVGHWTRGAGLVALAALGWAVFVPGDVFWTVVLAGCLVCAAVATAVLVHRRSIPTLAQLIEDTGAEAVLIPTLKRTPVDRSYLSPYFVTDPERMECVLQDALVLIHEKKISGVKDLLPLLEQIAKLGQPLLVVAEDREGEAVVCEMPAEKREALMGSGLSPNGGMY